MGFTDRNDRLPARGERVAGWVEAHMRSTGLTVPELAFRARVDKRDLRRLLNDRSCGSRLEDALADLFGWEFVDAVMAPAVGGDRLSMLERDLAQREAEAAAVHARIERERALILEPGKARLRVVEREASVRSAPACGGEGA